MPSPEELLAPISEDEPGGPDLSLSNEYAEIERAYHDADIPPTLNPAGVPEAPAASFSEVVALATDFLTSQSKDLKIAALLTGGLIREESFAGLATGLEIIQGLLKDYWDSLHPGVAGRAAILNWFGSEDVAYALYLVPLTEHGHHYYHYKEWTRGAAEGDEGESAAVAPSGAPSGGNFEQSFAETSAAWYTELCSALEHAATALESLDSLGQEKFAEADEKPPRYKDLAGALKRVTSGAQDLLGRKGGGSVEQPGDGQVSAPGVAGFIEPRDAGEAMVAIAVAARVLRHADPLNPAPYLLLRGLRWGELRAAGEGLNLRDLAAPSAQQRMRLRSLFLDEKWEELLEAVEEIMATPAGRGWLDLQRYAVLAAEGIGFEYTSVADSVRGALRTLLTDLPELVQATLMDDSASTSRDTVAWLEDTGLLSPELHDRLSRLDSLRAGGLSDDGRPQAASSAAQWGDEEQPETARAPQPDAGTELDAADEAYEEEAVEPAFDEEALEETFEEEDG